MPQGRGGVGGRGSGKSGGWSSAGTRIYHPHPIPLSRSSTLSFSISIISSCQIEQPFGAAFFMPIGGSGKEGAWSFEMGQPYLSKQNRGNFKIFHFGTNPRVNSQKFVVYGKCRPCRLFLLYAHPTPSYAIKVFSLSLVAMASAECCCGSPRPHNAVQVRRMPLRIEL